MLQGVKEKTVSIERAAELIGMSYGYVYAHVRKGEIPAYDFGHWVIPVEGLRAWVEARSNASRKVASLSRFQSARQRVRSLTTENTAHSPSLAQRNGVR